MEIGINISEKKKSKKAKVFFFFFNRERKTIQRKLKEGKNMLDNWEQRKKNYRKYNVKKNRFQRINIRQKKKKLLLE